MATSILIIEDEPMIAEAILYALNTDGFSTEWVSTGQAGLQALQNHKSDLIVMDVGLPDINGFELFRQINQRWSLPVIFLTARSSEIDRVVGLELGADDYIAKPFSPRELCARIRTVLRRVQRSQVVDIPSVAKTTSSFAIDDVRKIISYINTPLELSRIEYKLLQALLKQAGRVFTRNELMQQAWDYPDVSLDRTVDSHIKLLRNKLRAISPNAAPITTHRGLGYSLKE